jgi:hypothetical protein
MTTEPRQRRRPSRPAALRRAVLYARVSTDDKGQDPETQLRQLRDYAERRGFAVAGEFVDFASGTRNDRPQFKRLMEAARRREVDVVLVWRYDRFARSTQALVNTLMEFRALGVDFISHQGERRHHHAPGRAGVRPDGLPRPVRERADRRAGAGRHGPGPGARDARLAAAALDCERISPNASPVSFSTSTRAPPVSFNVSRRCARLRARARMFASGYTYKASTG